MRPSRRKYISAGSAGQLRGSVARTGKINPGGNVGVGLGVMVGVAVGVGVGVDVGVGVGRMGVRVGVGVGIGVPGISQADNVAMMHSSMRTKNTSLLSSAKDFNERFSGKELRITNYGLRITLWDIGKVHPVVDPEHRLAVDGNAPQTPFVPAQMEGVGSVRCRVESRAVQIRRGGL